MPGWLTSVTRLLSLEPWALRSLSKNFMADIRISLRNARGQSMWWWTIHFQNNFYLTCDRNLGFLLFTWICHLDLSKLRLIATCDRWHAWGRQCLLNLEYLVVLLAGPISHTNTQYIDFVDFFFIFHRICLPSILLISVSVELLLCVVVTLS